MTPHLDLDTIEAAAKAATPAWRTEVSEWIGGRFWAETPMVKTRAEAEADAHFIATANPETVLGLVEEVRRLRRVEKAWLDYAEAWTDGMPWEPNLRTRLERAVEVTCTRPVSGKGGER